MKDQKKGRSPTGLKHKLSHSSTASRCRFGCDMTLVPTNLASFASSMSANYPPVAVGLEGGGANG